MTGRDDGGRQAGEGAAYWLARLQADDSDAGDLDRFAAWRDVDPANSETYDRFKSQWERLATAASAPGIVDLRLEALSLQPSRQRVDWRQWGSIAAIFLLVVAGVTILVGMPRSSSLDRPSSAAVADAGGAGDTRHFANSYSTAVGQRMTVRLADGSSMDLNTNSLVEVDYSKDVRRLNLLRGEALFHVAKNPSRPFVVQAAREQVTALGTVFMVRRDENKTLIVLLEGKVKVDQVPAGNERGAVRPVAQLVPGQQLASLDGSQFALGKADLASVASWREGRLSFDDDRLSDVVAEVNRYSVRKLVIGDTMAGDLRISGTFRTGPADRFAQLLTQSFPVDVVPDKASNDLIVKGRPGTIK